MGWQEVCDVIACNLKWSLYVDVSVVPRITDDCKEPPTEGRTVKEGH